ncbi:ABC transporter ATP-binding protein [Candidatus Latescibacterota bacterium]
MSAILEARSLRKVYPGGRTRGGVDHVAVDNFSLIAGADRPCFVTIAGESGSGKTTIARLLLGMTGPTSGEVRFRGTPLNQLRGEVRRLYRREVQAIFQDPFEVYNPFYRVDHLLVTPLRRFGLAATKEQAYELARQALEAVGLRSEETLGRYPHQLSGGQRQRITIARALALHPRLIIADEPVSMVDASLRATILDSLRRLYRDHDIGFLYITHDLTTAYQVSDDIVILYRGTVVESGPVVSVIGDPRHPYTQALIDSIPAPDPGTSWLAERIDSDAADTGGEPIGGCPYAGICPQLRDTCHQSTPPRYDLGAGREAACFLYRDRPEIETALSAGTTRDGGTDEAP